MRRFLIALALLAGTAACQRAADDGAAQNPSAATPSASTSFGKDEGGTSTAAASNAIPGAADDDTSAVSEGPGRVEAIGPGEGGFEAFAPIAPEATTAKTGGQYGIGASKLPPPPDAACVSDAEFDTAMMGSGCDCSCDGYARGADRTCGIACGLAYYGCWAPDPSDAEVRAHLESVFSDTDPAARSLLADQMPPETVRAQIMLQRAQDWDAARRCPPQSAPSPHAP